MTCVRSATAGHRPTVPWPMAGTPEPVIGHGRAWAMCPVAIGHGVGGLAQPRELGVFAAG